MKYLFRSLFVRPKKPLPAMYYFLPKDLPKLYRLYDKSGSGRCTDKYGFWKFIASRFPPVAEQDKRNWNFECGDIFHPRIVERFEK